MTITGTGFVTGAVVSAGTPGLATFGTATVVSSTVITVPVTPVSFSGTVALSSSLTVTNPVGAGSATLAGGLVINPGPGVTGTYFVPTFSKNLVVPINGSGFEPGLTATSANADYTVIVGNVSATQVSLLVTTDSQATSGTSSLITFTNPDGGKVTFTLNGGPAVTPPPPVVLKITGFSGRIVTGTTSIFKIKGTGFTGQPRITSNAVGTKATVSGDTGKVLTVRVTVRAGTPRGVHTFTITFKSGKVLKLKYSQH
jgi:hypothetical protein